MTTFEEARGTVKRRIETLSSQIGIDLAIDDEATKDEEWCWVFFYNSQAYIETKSLVHALAGNGPIVVEKVAGRMHELTTATPFEDQLDDLR